MVLPLLAAAFLVASGPPSGPRMNAAEMEREFFGFDMSGVLVSTQTPFRECVEKDGRTHYWFGGTYDEGRLRIRPDGAMCFSYKSRNFADESCYYAQKRGQNYVFIGENTRNGTWRTTMVRRNFKSCPKPQVAVS